MLPEAGRAKISARVFELLRFMYGQYHKAVSFAAMQAGSHISLGTRTILEYLLSPVTGAFQEAARER